MYPEKLLEEDIKHTNDEEISSVQISDDDCSRKNLSSDENKDSDSENSCDEVYFCSSDSDDGNATRKRVQVFFPSDSSDYSDDSFDDFDPDRKETVPKQENGNAEEHGLKKFLDKGKSSSAGAEKEEECNGSEHQA